MKTKVLTLVPGPCTRTITAWKDHDHAGASTASHNLPWTTLRSWAYWILSVLCTSMAMSFLSGDRTLSNTAAKAALQAASSKIYHQQISMMFDLHT
jgi:hypothetical protein